MVFIPLIYKANYMIDQGKNPRIITLLPKSGKAHMEALPGYVA